ncbi:bifunctional 2-polyprenyl-6-hydroxyphenol methylase/3-demethylubiquinol 3-O-methyltransferase UbiG [Dysgonomonas sp. 520]|uniref:class I SAM-dependent methyltransferase n=1 Tax=Dysgonomonas sp. 520 TaxID=2302931 RepID=UPI0013D1EC43|nr:class I SAM-dependent methyltransferase [Dysgonomonas sp. 520]NDW10672.1 class I SAM-dependent methyltransferase [Dysgonomonas sp. 520]
MQERHLNRKQYFEEQAATCEKYYIPYIENIVPVSGLSSILEIGCADGGNLLPFAKRGIDVIGVDIMDGFIELAKENYKELGIKGTFIATDIFKTDNVLGTFDMVIVHDVIEHIYDKKNLLLHIKNFLKPGGVVFFGFPAWQMPFGGHQQLSRNKYISHMPFIHLLPNFIYKGLMKAGKEPESVMDELLDIKRCRISIGMFKKLAATTNFEILDERFYFINPHYEIKFGLKPRILPKFFSKIPYVRNFYTTACFFIIRPV